MSYVDTDSGFYNEKYIAVLKNEAGKSGIHEAMVIRFKTSGDKEKLAEVLKNWEPENSKIIVKRDGEFLVISLINKKSLAERFMSFVQENCEKEGIEVEASYEEIKI